MPTKSKNESNQEPSVVAEPHKETRVHAKPGRIPLEIVRTYYDPVQNCVIDVVKKEKIVKNRKGNDETITLEKHVFCLDEEIQAKYKRKPGRMIEVSNV